MISSIVIHSSRKILSWTFFTFLILTSIVLACGNVDFSSVVVTPSCLNARLITDSKDQFCDFVNWLSANLYVYNVTYYEPGAAITVSQQRQYARYLYDSIESQKSGSLSGLCNSAIKRFSCMKAFPFCPSVGTTLGSSSYLKPCKLQCSQMNSICGSDLPSQVCDEYPTTSCGLHIDSGFFVLSPEQGPFRPLVGLYIAALTCWFIMALLWYYLLHFPFKDHSLPVFRAVSLVPFCKVIVLLFALSFWVTCVEWEQCSYWLAVVTINAQLIYEAVQMMVLILLSKGWTITAEFLDPLEWRNIIVTVAGFYVVNSIIIVLQSSDFSTQGFLTAVGIVYGFVYLYILKNALTTLYAQGHMTKSFTSAMPQDVVGPSIMRFRMFLYFLVMVFVSLSVEFYAQVLFTVGSPLWTVLLVYEITNLCLFLVIGHIFRPRIFSPYFFMVPVRLTDVRMRSMPIVEAYEDVEKDQSTYASDIQLTSLLQGATVDNDPSGGGLEMTPSGGNAPKKMIMIKNPNNSLSLGLS